MYFPRRKFLQGLVSLGLTSCLGPFEVVRLNNAAEYDALAPDEDIKKINLAHLNAADLRGNTDNILKFISEEDAKERAQWLADFLKSKKIDILNLNEVDYAGTVKTGCLDQPKIIAEFLSGPYDYVVFDQYMKSASWTTGNAVISHFPMKARHRHLYGTSKPFDSRLGHLFKDFIHVEIKVGKRNLHFFTTHLDDSEGEYSSIRLQEAEEFIRYLKRFKQKNPNSYIVTAADYNDSYNSKTMEILLSEEIVHPPAQNFGLKTYQNGNPTRDLDHILASSNVAIHNYRTFEFPWSDHLGLMCELEFLE